MAVEASRTPGPGETVTRPPASAAETFSVCGTQLGLGGPAAAALAAPFPLPCTPARAGAPRGERREPERRGEAGRERAHDQTTPEGGHDRAGTNP